MRQTLDGQSHSARLHENRIASIGRLSASIAHEVSQPVSATVYNAQSALDWLSDPVPDIERVRLAVSRIVRDGSRAANVLRSLRALARKAPPRRDSCHLNEIIEDVIQLTHGEAVAQRVSVRANLARDLPVLRGDSVQLQQVILNLVINAIEAMSSVPDGKRELLISTEADSNRARVTVRDCGPGLDSKALHRIFEAFYTTKADGLGVGLSLCRSIIESHRGKVWASQNRGRGGATFSFTLPLDRPNESERIPTEGPTSPNAEARRPGAIG